MALNETPLTKMGQKTPKAEIYKSESHKLCHAFPVKVTSNVMETILTGSPVILNSDGTVSPGTSTTAPFANYLGIAVTDSPTPAYGAQRNYPVEVTVMMDGYAIITAEAAGDVVAGTAHVYQANGKRVVAQADAGQFVVLAPAEAGELVNVLVR